jgi:hypothetical protein
MPTTAVLEQTRRWSTYIVPAQPVITGFPVIRTWATSLTNRALLFAKASGLTLFFEPSFVPGTNEGIKEQQFIPAYNAGLVLPPSWSPKGTADSWGLLGRSAMPGELLVAPGNGSLSGKIYYLVAAGDVQMPASATGSSFNPVLSQNYFSNPTPSGQPGSIQVVSDTLATLPSPVVLAANRFASWSMICQLLGNGKGNGILTCNYSIAINGIVSSTGTFSSNRNPHREPQIQLSLGMQFAGSVSGSDTFQSTLVQFEIQNRA